jgi:cation:H+ antiporter
VALGLAFTDWSLDPLNALSAALALIGGAFLYFLVRKKEPIESEYLLVGGVLYAVFLVVALITIL